MKKYLLLIVSVFIISESQAQHQQLQQQVQYLMQYQFDKTTKYEDINLETLNYTGSPYINSSFLAGEIYHNNKLIADNIPLRYNALVDEMEFKPSFGTPDSESSALMKSPEIDVRIGSKVFIFVPYQGGIEKGGYFEVLLRGEKFDLFKKYNKRFTPEQKAQTSMTRDVPARFTDNPMYYLILENGRFVEIPSRARNFESAFVGKENEIRSFIRTNRLDIKNEADLIRIVNHYDSIN
jgi:hypothetical protein